MEEPTLCWGEDVKQLEGPGHDWTIKCLTCRLRKTEHGPDGNER